MTTTTKTIPLEALPEELQRVLKVLIPELGLNIAREVGTRLFVEIQGRSPVGHPIKDPHPGMYRASNTPSAGEPHFVQLPNLPAYPIPGAPEAEAAFADAAPGMPLYIGNAAADEGRDESYAGVLEGGRTLDKNGREIGSLQAPDGVYGPSIDALQGDRDKILATAIRLTEEKL